MYDGFTRENTPLDADSLSRSRAALEERRRFLRLEDDDAEVLLVRVLARGVVYVIL